MRDEKGWSKRVKNTLIFNKKYSGFENRLLNSITIFMGKSNQMYMFNSFVLLNKLSTLSPNSGGQNQPSVKLLKSFLKK